VVTALHLRFASLRQELIPFRRHAEKGPNYGSRVPGVPGMANGAHCPVPTGQRSRDATERRGPSLPADYAAPPKVGLLAVTEHGLQLSVEGATKNHCG
jgi:hypothetical protein